MSEQAETSEVNDFNLIVNVSALKRCDWGRVVRTEEDLNECDETVTSIQIMHSDEVPTYSVRICSKHQVVLEELSQPESEVLEDDLDKFIEENMKDPEFRAAYEKLRETNEQFAALMREREK